MKIVGLLAFRDEAPYLPYLLASLDGLVDEIIAVDDRSSDAGPDLLRTAGAHVLAAEDGSSFGSRRAMLLDAGRSRGGTHFVVVDADETFSRGFTQRGREVIESLAAGEGMAFPFRTLWRGPGQYRVGREYDIPLACVFRDDGGPQYRDAVIHEARLPPLVGLRRTLAASHGQMFHLQFVAWRRAQIKQCWYRCREMLDGMSAARVNPRYVMTLDGPFARTRPVQSEDLAHLPSLAPLVHLEPSWHLDEVLRWLRQYGPRHFEALQIWHVPEFHTAFIEGEHRPPRAATVRPYVVRAVGDLYGSARAAVRRVRRAPPS